MAITTGINSFIGESDFYNHLTTRLNADAFTYSAAIHEVGITDQATAQIINEMRGATFAEIETALTAANVEFNPILVEQAYNILTTGKTSIQINNEKALILATELINQFDFVGKPTTTTQPLQWPRGGAIDRNGQPIPEGIIPTGIKKATAELALLLLNYDLTNPRQYHHLYLMTSERIGESQASFSKRANKKLPDNVMDYLKPYLLEKSAFSSELIF